MESTESELINRLKFLWSDERKYKQRMIPALVVTVALCFTIFFFGPIEILAGSRGSVGFTVSDIAPVMGVFSIITCVFLTGILTLIRGKIFNFLISIEFAITLGAYIQGIFLNGSMGAMTGDAILWHTQKASLIISSVVWLAVIATVFLVKYFSESLWKKGLIFVSSVVVVMQLVALITLVTSGAFSYEKGYQLTNKGISEYSSHKNVLVFVLDRLDYDYVKGVEEKAPGFFDNMKGFTSYTNAIAEVGRTEPGINYMLTNDDDLYHVPQSEYFEKSWEKSGILKALTAKGMTVDVYTEIESMFGRGKSTKDMVRNMDITKDKVHPKTVIKNLSFMSLYRYVPYAIKPFFWYSTENISKGIFKGNNAYEIDQVRYTKRLGEFTTVEDKGQFKFIHFNGPHAPYTLNEKGEDDPENSDVVIQTMGSFNLLFKTFEKLKELGIYDKSSIIVLGDHGFMDSDHAPLKRAVKIGLFYKSPGSSGETLKKSKAPVSFKNIPATIARDSGVVLSINKKDKPKKALDQVGENEKVKRNYYKTAMAALHEKELYVYEVPQDASQFDKWVLKETKDVEKNYFY